jgi:hypothetical protein
VRERSWRRGRPSFFLERCEISRMMSPQGRSGLKVTKGYFLEETGRFSRESFSRSFFLEVACFALEALELKRWMKSFNCARFPSASC